MWHNNELMCWALFRFWYMSIFEFILCIWHTHTNTRTNYLACVWMDCVPLYDQTFDVPQVRSPAHSHENWCDKRPVLITRIWSVRRIFDHESEPSYYFGRKCWRFVLILMSRLRLLLKLVFKYFTWMWEFGQIILIMIFVVKIVWF